VLALVGAKARFHRAGNLSRIASSTLASTSPRAPACPRLRRTTRPNDRHRRGCSRCRRRNGGQRRRQCRTLATDSLGWRKPSPGQGSRVRYRDRTRRDRAAREVRDRVPGASSSSARRRGSVGAGTPTSFALIRGRRTPSGSRGSCHAGSYRLPGFLTFAGVLRRDPGRPSGPVLYLPLATSHSGPRVPHQARLWGTSSVSGLGLRSMEQLELRPTAIKAFGRYAFGLHERQYS
jgi:hypothetical protein